MVHLDESYQGAEVALTVGDELEVVQPENRTTGYRWHAGLDDASVLELVEESFRPPDGLVGSGGHRRWLFRAVRPGAGSVELVYRRPWETAAGRRLAIPVVVGP